MDLWLVEDTEPAAAHVPGVQKCTMVLVEWVTAEPLTAPVASSPYQSIPLLLYSYVHFRVAELVEALKIRFTSALSAPLVMKVSVEVAEINVEVAAAV